MNLRLSICFLASLLLTGCYTLHVQPQSGPVATITFEKDSTFKYSVATYVNASDCSGGRIIVSPILDQNSTTLKFVAGKSIALSFNGDMGASASSQDITFFGCDSTIVFTPISKETYRSLFSASGGKCQLELLKADGTPLHPDEYQTRQWIRPAFDTGSFCRER
jgi:hypothetical protein